MKVPRRSCGICRRRFMDYNLPLERQGRVAFVCDDCWQDISRTEDASERGTKTRIDYCT